MTQTLEAQFEETVGEIIGSEFEIPENIRGKVNEMVRYTIQWLDYHGYGENK